MGIPFKDNDRIVFVGDSITESGRFSQPPLGNGYVYIFYNLLLAKYPEIDVEVINSGISGNTVKDLLNRWDDDVLSFKPGWISIMIGINDIHRYLGGVDPDLDPESYYNIYRSILEKIAQKLEKELSIGTIIVTLDFPISSWSPFFVKHIVDEKGFDRFLWFYAIGISNPMARRFVFTEDEHINLIQTRLAKRKLYLY